MGRPARRWRTGRWARRLLAASPVVVASLVLGAGPAAAHAQLESTDPPRSSVLLVSPPEVLLHFDEAVTVDFGAVRVLAPGGRRVDEGGAHHPAGDGRAVAVALPRGLPAATYVVAWRVISDDSHPVQGGFVFSVGTGAGAGRAESVARVLAAATGSTAVGSLYAVVRFASFAALLVLVGLGAAALLVWPPAAGLRRVRAVLWGSWAALALLSVAGIAVQGAYAASLPVGRVLSPTLFGEVVHTRFGAVALLRLALLVASAPVLLAVGRWGGAAAPNRRATAVAGALVGAALLATPGLAGHASTIGNGVAGELLDVAHLGAAALWTGGLLLLAALLLPGLPAAARPAEPGAPARAFGPWALGAVAVVVATGLLQSVRQVGSRYALLHTPYGDMLLVKVGLVALAVAVGALSRRVASGGWIGARPAAPARRGASGLLAGELLVVAGVLAVTAGLVNAAPARQAAAAPFTATFDVRGVQVDAVVAPCRVGTRNQFHFYVLGAAGEPVAVAELGASIALRPAGVGARTVPLVVAAPGHYQAPDVDIPAAGSWELTVTVRTATGGEQVVRATMPVH